MPEKAGASTTATVSVTWSAFHKGDDEMEYCNSKHVVGYDLGDAAPLCAKHMKHPDCGDTQLFSKGLLAAIKKRRLAYYKTAKEKPSE